MRSATVLFVALLGLVASAAAADTLSVGPGKTYQKPSTAIAAAKEGDVIEIDPAGTYDGDVCRIATNKLTIRGGGRGRVKLPAAGKISGGKAFT